MYVANAHKQSKRIPKNDSPATAGVGKLPAQTVTNRAELKALGERMGWKARPLTEKEIKGGMSGQELIWHETYSPAEVEKALSSVDEYNREVRHRQSVKKLWDQDTQATPEEAAKIWQALQRFKQTYPQFIESNPANAAVLLWLKDRNMEVTFPNLQEAFEDCAMNGTIHLNPSAIAAGSQTDVSGDDLKRHHNFHKLIQPQQRVSDVDRMSGDEFKTAAQNTHPELKDQRVPQIVAARSAKAEATAQHFTQAAEHTNKADVVTLVDYPDQPHGVPPESEKFSFKTKIRSMSATELAERCQLDPAFKKALDEM